MKNRFSLRAVAVTAAACCLLGAFAQAQLEKVLKGGAIAVVVDKFGPEINKGINALTAGRKLGPDQATKVVPILSIGRNQYAGAVQVTGPQEQVDKVKAVAQLEGNVSLIGGIRIKALIPIQARSATNLSRVPGVGVSALVDIKL